MSEEGYRRAYLRRSRRQKGESVSPDLAGAPSAGALSTRRAWDSLMRRAVESREKAVPPRQKVSTLRSRAPSSDEVKVDALPAIGILDHVGRLFPVFSRMAYSFPDHRGASEMDPTLKALALYTSATQNALVILAKCLMNNGALKPGQFSAALKSTFNEGQADWQRLDYQYFRSLAALLDEAEKRDRLSR